MCVSVCLCVCDLRVLVASVRVINCVCVFGLSVCVCATVCFLSVCFCVRCLCVFCVCVLVCVCAHLFPYASASPVFLFFSLFFPFLVTRVFLCL